MIGKDEFLRFNNAKNEDKCLDISETAARRMTEEEAERTMQKLSHCKNAAEFQALPVKDRDSYLRRMLEAGVSIRQASRITGVSPGIVRKFR